MVSKTQPPSSDRETSALPLPKQSGSTARPSPLSFPLQGGTGHMGAVTKLLRRFPVFYTAELQHENPQIPVCSCGRLSDALAITRETWSVWEGDRREKWSRVSIPACRKHYLRLSWLFGASDGSMQLKCLSSTVFCVVGGKVAWPP